MLKRHSINGVSLVLAGTAALAILMSCPAAWAAPSLTLSDPALTDSGSWSFSGPCLDSDPTEYGGCAVEVFASSYEQMEAAAPFDGSMLVDPAMDTLSNLAGLDVPEFRIPEDVTAQPKLSFWGNTTVLEVLACLLGVCLAGFGHHIPRKKPPLRVRPSNLGVAAHLSVNGLHRISKEAA